MITPVTDNSCARGLLISGMALYSLSQILTGISCPHSSLISGMVPCCLSHDWRLLSTRFTKQWHGSMLLCHNVTDSSCPHGLLISGMVPCSWSHCDWRSCPACRVPRCYRILGGEAEAAGVRADQEAAGSCGQGYDQLATTVQTPMVSVPYNPSPRHLSASYLSVAAPSPSHPLPHLFFFPFPFVHVGGLSPSVCLSVSVSLSLPPSLSLSLCVVCLCLSLFFFCLAVCILLDLLI